MKSPLGYDSLDWFKLLSKWPQHDSLYKARWRETLATTNKEMGQLNNVHNAQLEPIADVISTNAVKVWAEIRSKLGPK
jgi:hypothetical protein